MIRINLLPYREAMRKEQARILGLWLAVCLIVLGMVYYGVYWWFDSRLENQQVRVDYLKQEIVKLDEQIKTIADIKVKRQTMLDRLDVVEKLQSQRGATVKMFNELASRTPIGAYFSKVEQVGNDLQLEGYADSNGQISELMRALEASPLFDAPVLDIISRVEMNGVPVGQFKMHVKLSTAEDTAGQDKAQDKP